MKNRHRLTHDQLRFLCAVRDDGQTLELLTERMKLKPWLLSKWLRRQVFRESLAEVLKEMHRRRELEFGMAARHATNKLSSLICGGSGTHLERQSSFDLLDLYFSRKRPGRKVMKVNPMTADPSRPLIHPDVDPAEARELIDQMHKSPEPSATPLAVSR